MDNYHQLPFLAGKSSNLGTFHSAMVVGPRLQGTPETGGGHKISSQVGCYSYCMLLTSPSNVPLYIYIYTHIHIYILYTIYIYNYIHIYIYICMYAWTNSLPGHWNDGLLISIGENILKRLYFRLWMIIIHPDDDDPNWLVYCEWVESTNEWLTSVYIYIYMYVYIQGDGRVC